MKMKQFLALAALALMLPIPSSAQPAPHGLGAVTNEALHDACISSCLAELYQALDSCREIEEQLREVRMENLRNNIPVSSIFST